MFLFFGVLSFSLTWDEISQHISKPREAVQKRARESRNKYTINEPKLYQSEKSLKKIKENRPFVGIVDCVFDTIADQTNGIIELENSITHIINSQFTNIQDSYAIYLCECRLSDIKNCSFTNIANSGAIKIYYSNNIRVMESTFSNINATTPKSSVIHMDNSQSVFIKNSNFTSNNVFASLCAHSSCYNVVFDACNFRDNEIVCPGCVFFHTCLRVFVLNCEFTDNVCYSHSAAILSVSSSITLKRDLFARNRLDFSVNLTDYIINMGFYSAAATVTIISPVLIKETKCPNNFENLYFDNNAQIPSHPMLYYSLDTIDMLCSTYLDRGYEVSTVISVEGVIETTNAVSHIEFNGLIDNTNIKGNVKQVNYPNEPFYQYFDDFDYSAQANMPAIRFKRGDIYSTDPVIYGTGKLTYMIIEHCDFSNCFCGLKDVYEDKNSLIYINLEKFGHINIAFNNFNENYVDSSLIQISQCMGCSITECKFKFNVAKHSSCFFLHETDVVRISSCTFDRNDAFVHGAVSLYNCGEALITQCNFKKNIGFAGCSCVIFNNTNLIISDTMFTRNNIDHEKWDLNTEVYHDISDSELLKPHSNISNVFTPKVFAVSLSGYGKSSLSLENVGFKNSEVENDMNTTELTVASLDVYVEDSVLINSVIDSYTDTRKNSCNKNISLTYTDESIILKPYLWRFDYYWPFFMSIDKYSIEKENEVYVIKKEGDLGIIDLPDEPCKIFLFTNEDEETENNETEPDVPDRTPTPIYEKKGNGKMIGLIVFGSIIFVTAAILIGAAVYFCKRPPESRLRDDPNDPNKRDRKKGLLENKNDDEPPIGP